MNFLATEQKQERGGFTSAGMISDQEYLVVNLITEGIPRMLVSSVPLRTKEAKFERGNVSKNIEQGTPVTLCLLP